MQEVDFRSARPYGDSRLSVFYNEFPFEEDFIEKELIYKKFQYREKFRQQFTGRKLKYLDRFRGKFDRLSKNKFNEYDYDDLGNLNWLDSSHEYYLSVPYGSLSIALWKSVIYL